MVIVVWIVSEAVIGVRHAGGPGDLRQDRLSGPALIGSVVLSVVLGSNLATQASWASIGTGREALFGLGLFVAIGGVALRQAAVAALGRFFTTRVTTRADQTVVDTGPYRYVRHPSYSGMLITVLGVLLCSTNWVSLACFALAIPGTAYRIRVEERALAGALGEPYRAYMSRTKRLVPFVV